MKVNFAFLNDNRFRRHAAARQSILQLQSFHEANPPFRAKVDTFRLQQFLETVGNRFTALRQSQRRELDYKPAIVAVDGQAGKAVALTENQAAGIHRAQILQNRFSQTDGGNQAGMEKRLIERSFLGPGIQAHANFAPGIVEPTGDEMAGVRNEIDFRTISRFPVKPGNGAGIDPRMAAVKRLCPARLQNSLRKVHEMNTGIRSQEARGNEKA